MPGQNEQTRALSHRANASDGQVEVDLTGRKAGRGAYICDYPGLLGARDHDELAGPRAENRAHPETKNALRSFAATIFANRPAANEDSERRDRLMVVNYEEGTQSRQGGRRAEAGRGRGKNQRGGGARTVALRRTAPVVREPVALPPVMTVAELADYLQTTPIEIIKELMKLEVMANINQQIDYNTAARVATALNWETIEDVPEAIQRGERRL